ncbi:hypothetical protein I7I48_06490 [Histoplasma ohiense]|nr:hypothetical protein I7I48_06490 [Histoplasma ohiense (nom. inval.)]
MSRGCRLSGLSAARPSHPAPFPELCGGKKKKEKKRKYKGKLHLPGGIHPMTALSLDKTVSAMSMRKYTHKMKGEKEKEK